MSAPVIIGGVLVGGYLYLRWKKKSAPAGGATDACDKFCAVAAPIESKVAGSQGVPVPEGLAASLCKLSPAYIACRLFGGSQPFKCPEGTVQAEDHRSANPLHAQLTNVLTNSGGKQWMYGSMLQNANVAKDTAPGQSLAVSVCVPPRTGPPPVVIGTGMQTAINCASLATNKTITWDPSNGGFWRRIRIGETQNLGPCDTRNGDVLATPVQHAIMLK